MRKHTAPAIGLVDAAHPWLVVSMSLAATGLAAAMTRPPREVALVAITVAVSHIISGWHNDLVDADDDIRHWRRNKPIPDGALHPETLNFAVYTGVLVLIPLAVANGIVAGLFILASTSVALSGNLMLRRTPWSWVTWALGTALLVPFLTYGGWAGTAVGAPPNLAVVFVAGLVGIATHCVVSVPGLVRDYDDGSRSLPVLIGHRIGATPLLVLATTALIGLLLTGLALGMQGSWTM